MKMIFACTFLLIAGIINAQEIPQKVAVEICNCVDTIENMDSLEAKVDRCAQDALETVLESSSDEVQEIYSSDDAVEETINKAMENLLTVCPKIKKFIIEERKEHFYRRSASEESNKYYYDANKLFETNDYKGALKLYSRALKKDPGYIYAIDNIGLTYRKLGDKKNAIKWYLKSLDLYPEGSFALQNIAYVYIDNNDLKSALMNYQKLAFFYPDDPEGYFGIGKLYVASGEYEAAMDYVFTAHRIYSVSKSEYLKECEQLITVIYNKLKELDKLDSFNRKAKEYGINLN
ncbi:MAG: tetratricopeptide repeat protein [Bacteroidales bacterium]|jgi:tetratricopeptide (TPR) repeat protein